MADREKVVRAVETCFDSWIDKHRNMGLDLHEVERMKRDALELLKEQEPQSVIVKCEPSNGNILWFANCPKCGQGIERDKHKNHCGYCGQAVKWDG